MPETTIADPPYVEPAWLFVLKPGMQSWQVWYRCVACGRELQGNSGLVSHGRSHVRRGEAIEQFSWGDAPGRFIHIPKVQP